MPNTTTPSGPASRFLSDIGRTLMPAEDSPHGPLPPMLLVLTFVTGLVDAVSYLRLGHVFVANMTGNTVFIGFGLAGAASISVPSSLVAMGAFLVGAGGAGWLCARIDIDRGRLLAIGTAIESLLLLGALAAVIATGSVQAVHYLLIVLLAVAMAVQNAVARSLAVPELKTTVLTLTITGLAADMLAGAGISARPGRRLLAIVTMLAGALVGGLLALHVAVSVALLVALLLMLSVALACHVLSRSRPAWTHSVA